MVGEPNSGSQPVTAADTVGISGSGSSAEPLAAVHDVALLDLDGVVHLGVASTGPAQVHAATG